MGVSQAEISEVIQHQESHETDADGELETSIFLSFSMAQATPSRIVCHHRALRIYVDSANITLGALQFLRNIF